MVNPQAGVMIATRYCMGAMALLAWPTVAATCEPVAIKPNEFTLGRLRPQDCRMSGAFLELIGDNRYVKLYAMEIPESGTLTVDASSSEFTPQLLLPDVPHGGTAQHISVSVAPGRYLIYITSTGAEGGSYKLITTFTTKVQQTCPERRLDLQGAQNGDLTRGDCKYRVKLPSRGTLKVGLEATDAELMIRKSTGEIQNHRDPRRFSAELEGEYVITVHGRSGTYTLSSTFCPGLRDLALDSHIESTISQACTAAEGANVRQYTLTVPTGAFVRIALAEHNGFDAALSLSGPGVGEIQDKTTVTRALAPGRYTLTVKALNGGTGAYTLLARTVCRVKPIAANAVATNAFSATSCQVGEILGTADRSPAVVYRLHVEQGCRFSARVDPSEAAALKLLDLAGEPAPEMPNPGDYLLLLGGRPGDMGSFSIQTTCRRACVPEELRLGEDIEGQISQNDCRVSDVLDSPDGSLARLYHLTLGQAVSLYIDLSSTAAASLVLFQDVNDVLAESQKIQRRLQPGTYSLLVKQSGPGSYRVQASVQCATTNPPNNQPFSDELSVEDCSNGAGSYYKQYRVVVERNSVLDLKVFGKGFEPILTECSPSMRTQPAIRPRRGGLQQSSVQQILEAGRDCYFQMSSADPSKLGGFDLIRRLFPLHDLETNRQGPPASFNESDCLETSCVQYHRVFLQGDVTVTLRQRGFAPRLELLDSGWNVLERAETVVKSHDLQPASYIIRVSTEGRSSGSYDLNVDMDKR
jgi:hypothetical protein